MHMAEFMSKPNALDVVIITQSVNKYFTYDQFSVECAIFLLAYLVMVFSLSQQLFDRISLTLNKHHEFDS